MDVGGKKIGDEEVLLVYLNDDGIRISSWVTLLEIGDFVKFRTPENIISIPRERVLKIKERLR